MKRAVGLLVLLLGIATLAAGLSIGVPFTLIYGLGFVGTGGREAGRELGMFLSGTLVTCALGYGLIVLGRAMRRP